MDNDHTELLETLQKHGWERAHWDERVCNKRANRRLTIEAMMIGALILGPLAFSAWQFIHLLFAG